MLSGRRFLAACTLIAGLLFGIGRLSPLPLALLAIEVFATILGLFFFGSFKYQIHKNALTYGMLLVIIATFIKSAGIGVACRDRGSRMVVVGQGAPLLIPRTRRADSCGHDALHPRPDVFRFGHRADSAARRHHVFSASSQPRRDPAHGHFRHGGRRLRLGHPRWRLDDWPDDSDISDHHDACRRTSRSRPLRRDGVHRRYDDLRDVAGVRGTPESHHEGEPRAPPRQRLLPRVLRSRGDRCLSHGRVSAAYAAAWGNE